VLILEEITACRWALAGKLGPRLRTDIGQDEFLLMGLALECILKGEIMQGYLREQPDLLKEDRDPLGRDDIPKSIKQGSSEITAGSHDLLKLAGKAGFKVNDERQRRLLEDIARLVTWKARYPVPKRAKDFRDWKGLGDLEWKICSISWTEPVALLRRTIGATSRSSERITGRSSGPPTDLALNEAQARANSVNLDLDSQDLTVATDIARDVRERDGGLPCAKALGLYLDAPRPRPGVRGSN
jgi:hypothetical protein